MPYFVTVRNVCRGRRPGTVDVSVMVAHPAHTTRGAAEEAARAAFAGQPWHVVAARDAREASLAAMLDGSPDGRRSAA